MGDHFVVQVIPEEGELWLQSIALVWIIEVLIPAADANSRDRLILSDHSERHTMSCRPNLRLRQPRSLARGQINLGMG
jgi:hypothetical protein